MAAPVCSIYDARDGQNFRAVDLYGGESVSSLTDNLFVVDCVGEVAWGAQSPFISELMLATSAMGFFAITPWFPASKRLGALLATHFKVREFDGGLLVGYFEPSAEQFAELLAVREQAGGSASGEILLGGCTQTLDLSRMKVPGGREPWSLVISQRSRIGCFLYLGELQRSTLLVRLGSRMDHLLVPWCVGFCQGATS